MLISPDYRELNEQMHRDKPSWSDGHGLTQWLVGRLIQMVRRTKATSILDYGAGSRSLERLMPTLVRSYDPAIPGIDKAEPADIVVSLSVLEHVEPDCLDDVLAHMASLTRKEVLLIISTVESGVKLPDGSSPHRIIENATWWVERLIKHWDVMTVQTMDKRFMFKGTTRGPRPSSSQ